MADNWHTYSVKDGAVTDVEYRDDDVVKVAFNDGTKSKKRTLALVVDEGNVITPDTDQGANSIKLTVINKIPTWVAGHAYVIGDVVISSEDSGVFYVCVGAGTSGSAAPVWIETNGARIQDGSVLWSAKAGRIKPEHVRLALDEAGLSSATWGGELVLSNDKVTHNESPIIFVVEVKNPLPNNGGVNWDYPNLAQVDLHWSPFKVAEETTADLGEVDPDSSLDM